MKTRTEFNEFCPGWWEAGYYEDDVLTVSVRSRGRVECVELLALCIREYREGKYG